MIAFFTVGYYRVIEHKPIPNQQRFFISIIICFRNEESNIAGLFDSIRELDYPQNDYEIIAVDDHSTDSTNDRLKEQRQSIPNLRIVSLCDGMEGKKAALKAGVLAARSTVIAVTDADCLLPKYWLTTINNLFGTKSDVVCGPVAYQANSTFEHLAAIEFASLIASGIGAAGIHNPIFCNGANMAFKKEVFAEANLNEEHTPSGDDVFLLHYAKLHHKKISFATGLDSLVLTAADKTPAEFLNRRKRWGSKAKYYEDIRTKQVAILVVLANATILASFVAALFNHELFKLAAALFVAKTVIDYGLLSVHFRINGIKKWFKYFVACAALYPIYITFTAIGSITSKFTWKERRYREQRASRPGHNRGES